jgi:SAM-dependent methyltransferase
MDDPKPDLQSVTAAQKRMWSSGDFTVIGRQLMPVSEALCETMDPRPNERVLDVGCGSGNAALVAARRFCEVTGVDYVPELVERARLRAAAEGTPARFEVADAQALPFPEASFDLVLSTVGVMFAPDQTTAAGELLRVCRPGGRIGLASWTPEGWGGDLIAVHARHLPPPPGLPAPARWGTLDGVTALLAPGARLTGTRRRTVRQHFRSVDHGVATFQQSFGPTARAFQTLDAVGQEALRAELAALFRRHNRATDGTVSVECEYLEVAALRG